MLTAEQSEQTMRRALEELPGLGVRVISSMISPIKGGAGKKHQGNIEYLAMVEPGEARVSS